jgi:hypothetical protein
MALAAIQLSLSTTGVNLDFAIGRRYATAIEPRLKIAKPWDVG